MVGEFPNVPKLVAIAAPHSSNWDAIIGLLFKVGLGIDVHFIAKQEAFFWPLGSLLRALGGIATDRNAAHGVVGQMNTAFSTNPKFWLAIAPEGTRKKVTKWKSGFWHIARRVGVPILPVYFHYPEKIIGLGPPIVPTENLEADMARVRAFYAPFQGKNRGTV
jgi:1-acyl-sn-glycerol-3-phosphate acyltransferase